MKYLTTLFFLFCSLSASFAQINDYPILYRSDFNSSEDLKKFQCSDPAAWRINTQYSALELFGKSDYQPPVRSPKNIALLKDIPVGSFVLDMDLKQTGKEYGHRDMCIFFGMKDATNFYYVHLASKADQNAHNIFLVNDEARRNIAEKTTAGIDWGNDWHRVRIVRYAQSGIIEVYFDDLQTPIMEATDVHFQHGLIGFGSFDDTGMVDNIVLSGERFFEEKGFFKK
ncbi:MAG: hypothetical protein AAF849_01710 [Bacteroidota bacterium]